MLPCSSFSAKRRTPGACSLASALTTALATAFLQVGRPMGGLFPSLDKISILTSPSRLSLDAIRVQAQPLFFLHAFIADVFLQHGRKARFTAAFYIPAAKEVIRPRFFAVH